MSERFRIGGSHVFDRWRGESLCRLAIASSPGNLARLHDIFAFHSNLLQNIVEFTPGNFRTHVLTQPFRATPASALARLPEKTARGILRRYLVLLEAAREWRLDFIDFSRFQVLPGGGLRFPWSLERREPPEPAAVFSLFRRHGRLRGLEDGDWRRAAAEDDPALLREGRPFLCRREDFASSLLRSRPAGSVSSGTNARVRINTKSAWQKAVVQDSLYHSLSGNETLLLKTDLERAPLSDGIASLCGRKRAGGGSMAAQARELRLFQKKTVYREIILVVENLAKKEDDRLLRFLLESEELSGLTAVLFGDATSSECDLEFNEDPPDLLARHYPSLTAGQTPDLDDDERSLLERIARVGVPVPRDVALLLAAGKGDSRIVSLLKKRLLLENRERGTLEPGAGHGTRQASPREADEQMAWLAANSGWAYAGIAHSIASGRPADLERCLEKLANDSSGQRVTAPIADRLARHLPSVAPGTRIVEHGLDILIRGNFLAQAEAVLASLPDADAPFARLKRAHLALRRKTYRELGVLMAGLPHPPAGLKDEWLYLNFIYLEMTSAKGRADEYSGRIRSPYYRNLALIRLSDRSIYNRDFARARAQLEAASRFFTARGHVREMIEVQSQMAKLFRERGDVAEAEVMYKTLFVQSEADGLALNAAAAAVDLGNLYLEGGDDFHAECWYRKAERLFAREGSRDGLMLVKANLVNVFLAKGHWLEADRLLHALHSWNEEKELRDSSAIDLLNRAELELLRRHDERALELAESAAARFRDSANRKGLGECAFLKGRVTGFEAAAPLAPRPGNGELSADQEGLRRLLGRAGRPDDPGWEAGLFRELDGIGSRKIRFEALRLLLKKHRRGEWLERFQEIALELSPREKNYFFYEYWHMVFELAPEGPLGPRRDEFLEMYDFFTVNRRTLSAKLARLRRQCDDSGREGELFDDARLVERSRNWRLPADFFNAFLQELAKAAPIDWLVMAVREGDRPLFRFASTDSFRELGDEMLQRVLEGAGSESHDLHEVRRRFRSRERLFYPFAVTKAVLWPVSERLRAGLVIGSRDRALYFQDMLDRQREIFRKFSDLLLNFLRHEHRVDEKLDFIVGASGRIRELKRLIARVSQVDFSVLITGESGSGKELVAQAVHRLGPRAGRPFISVNAAAIPETLLEAELFGYRKGAFSGAHESRTGLLEAADSGTLFLDEIADLPLALQAKLLRALQEREIRRLGENRTVAIDVRLVSASNRDLGELMRQNLFREDLYYRLQDLVLRIPPLRERREDIPLLIGHFLKKFGYPAQSPSRLEAIAAMFRDDDFPGNVRELESRVKNLITFHPDLELPATPGRTAGNWRNARAEFEIGLLRRTLNEAGWNRSEASRRLGISRMALFNLIKKHRIEA